VQAENPQRSTLRLACADDGRPLPSVCDLVSGAQRTVRPNFTRLDASRFDEIALLPWADCVALLPQPEELP
jgi:hypothetical protein